MVHRRIVLNSRDALGASRFDSYHCLDEFAPKTTNLC